MLFQTQLILRTRFFSMKLWTCRLQGKTPVLKGNVLLFRASAKGSWAHLISFLKARMHCEIFLSDYFMKHSLMHISLHIIRFHKIYVKYVKRNHSRTIIRKCSICFEYVFSKNSTKQKTKRKRNVKVKPWLKNRRYTTTFNNIYMRSWWLMRLKNQYCFVLLFISCLIE